MKKTNILYWIFTGIFGAFMMFTAVNDLTKNSLLIITDTLGYPEYIIPFLGIAKALGVITILVPGFTKLKEWAYAGLFFDLLGATYSSIAVEGFHVPMLFMVLPFSFLFLSYAYHHKRLNAKL